MQKKDDELYAMHIRVCELERNDSRYHDLSDIVNELRADLESLTKKVRAIEAQGVPLPPPGTDQKLP